MLDPTLVNLPDVWQILRCEARPLVIYGMGNGADKLIERLAAIGKKPAAIFASDDFVRGQSFHGFRVCRFSDIQAQFSDFVILVSFGTRVPSVMARLFALANAHTLYLPDMPVVGNTDFTQAFFKEHEREINKVYTLLEDDLSRQIYESTLRYKISGDIRYLQSACSSPEQERACLPIDKIKIAIDGGAYCGDTAYNMLKDFPNLERIYAIEPDKKTFKKLEKFAAGENGKGKIHPIYAALWHECGQGCFFESGNRNSSLLSASYEHKDVTVPLLTVDAISKGHRIDYIKYDVEGSEREALLGSVKTILCDRPAIAISLYHRSEDLYSLPLHLHGIDKKYRFYIRRPACLPAWEMMLYAV